MIAASPAPPAAYLWEPFSVLHRPGILDVRFPFWFPYVTNENGGSYVTPIQDMLRFRYKVIAELRSVRNPKDAARLVRDRSRFASWRRRKARPLLKDPIAIYSAEWLDDTFDMDVIVLIRHPAAFVNSIVSRQLRHPFDHFLRQPLLMRDVLAPYASEISRFADVEQPLLDQGILLWNLLHAPIERYQRERLSWTFLRLEDVASAPDASFRAVYGRLGLVYDASVRASWQITAEPRTRRKTPTRPRTSATARQASSRGSAGSLPPTSSGSGPVWNRSRTSSTPMRTGRQR